MKCKYCSKETLEKFCSIDCKENYMVFHIIEPLIEELDIFYKATSYPWKVELTTQAYDILKNHPGTHWVPEQKAYLPRKLIYEKDGYEYLICWENHNIPFIIHARIADKDAGFNNLELDDLNRPNIVEEHREDFNNYCNSVEAI